MRHYYWKVSLFLLLCVLSIGFYQVAPTLTQASSMTQSLSVDISGVDAGWIDRLGESEVANRIELLQDVRQSQIPVTSTEAQESEGIWTILLYMAADNNLESFALKDLAELEFWGSSQDVRVIVQIDRSDEYDTTDGNWTDARRYFITSDFGVSISSIDSELVGEVGETNTGDPDALVDFATWAIDTYPSENYALVLWNHGGSWFGAASDDSHDGDELTLTEIDQALSDIREQTGRDQFELVGFDACLMGALEVYQTLAPHAEYAIASPELVPGNGWEYTMLLSDLQLNPNQTPSEVGQSIVDRFMEFYTVQVSNYDVFSMSLIDLSFSDRLNIELQGFTDQFNVDAERALEIVSRVRRESFVHGGFDDPQYVDVWAAVDLVQLMEEIAHDPTYPELARAAQRVVNASRDFVSYHRGNGPFAETGGLSIYFPRTATLYERRGRNNLYEEETPAQLDTWRTFLDSYYSSAISAGLQQAPGDGQVTGGRSGQSQVLLDLGLQGTGIVNAGFYVTYLADDGLPVLIDYDRVGITSQQQIRWVPQIPFLSDGENEVPVLLVVNRTNPTQGIINGGFIPQNGSEISAQLVIDLETGRVTSAWGIRETAGGQMPSELEIQSGDQFRPSWISLSQENEFTPRASDTVLIADADASNFLYLLRDAPRGSFEIGVFTENLTGNASQSSVSLNVEDNGNSSFSGNIPTTQLEDRDGDTIPNNLDNCPSVANTLQRDSDFDGRGDACDPINNLLDTDDDGVADYIDNCPIVFNPEQQDSDYDFIGDACADDDQALTGIGGEGCYEDEELFADLCEDDLDEDGVPDFLDNCPYTFNPEQRDGDFDFIGDACQSLWETDTDGDGLPDFIDNCPMIYNPQQYDSDYDEIGDACDDSGDDWDGDGVIDLLDNCVFDYNPQQVDSNENGFGDACDYSEDYDGDGWPDYEDSCPYDYNPDQNDVCGLNDDSDEDGWTDDLDNCPFDYNPDQIDSNENGIGDECDTADSDGDGLSDSDEYDIGSDPFNADTDGDGLIDGDEVFYYFTSPTNADTDGDGVADGTELDLGRDPTVSDNDSDSDGVYDQNDSCPFDFGTLPNGCPDSDGDGVQDNLDSCPFTFGSPQTNGCPDSDGDGFSDLVDNCISTPNDQADANTNGIGDACDDRDGDGFIDTSDACPDAGDAGFGVDSSGCPIQDSDADSVPDPSDNCPTVANGGQADDDGDGVGNACDSFPNDPDEF